MVQSAGTPNSSFSKPLTGPSIPESYDKESDTAGDEIEIDLSDDDHMQSESQDPPASAAECGSQSGLSPSGRLRYDFSKLKIPGPISTSYLQLLLEEFIYKKKYTEASYKAVMNNFKINQSSLKNMLACLQSLLPAEDWLSRKITTIINKWPQSPGKGNKVDQKTKE